MTTIRTFFSSLDLHYLSLSAAGLDGRMVRNGGNAKVRGSHSEPINITADVLEKCLDRVALLIEQSGNKGAVYLPIYERLEAELNALKAKEERMARIRARIRR